jgi:hypothetical protein
LSSGVGAQRGRVTARVSKVRPGSYVVQVQRGINDEQEHVYRPEGDTREAEWVCTCGWGDSRQVRWCDHILAVFAALHYREPAGVQYTERFATAVEFVPELTGSRGNFTATAGVGGVLWVLLVVQGLRERKMGAWELFGLLTATAAVLAAMLLHDYREWQRGDAWRSKLLAELEAKRKGGPGRG